MSETPKRTTARYARLPLDFIVAPTTRGWNDQEKLLSFYYRGNPNRTLEGLYRCPLSYAANDLGWSVKQIAARTEILVRDGFCSIDQKTDLILLRHALAEQWPESENVLKGVMNRVRALPQSHLLQEFLTLAKTHCGKPDSPPSALTFVLWLRRTFEPQSEPLNLQSESTIHNQQSQSRSRRNGAGRDTNVSLSTMRGNQEDAGMSQVKTVLQTIPLLDREEGNGHHNATPEAIIELWNARPGLTHIPKNLRASVLLLDHLQQHCLTHPDLKLWSRLFDAPELFTEPGHEKPIELLKLVEVETFHMVVAALEESSYVGH